MAKAAVKIKKYKRSEFYSGPDPEEQRADAWKEDAPQMTDEDLEFYRKEFNKHIYSGNANDLDIKKKTFINKELKRRKSVPPEEGILQNPKDVQRKRDYDAMMEGLKKRRKEEEE